MSSLAPNTVASPDPAVLAAAQGLLPLISGDWLGTPLTIVATLGVADQCTSGPRTIDQLAATLNVHGETLYRLMRALASVGVFTETAPRTFGLTPIADLLRSDHPQSMRAMARMINADWHRKVWDGLPQAVRSGASIYEHQLG
ncbi:MAG: hypothetical protein ABI743_07660, partial [bacterium]